MCTKDDSKRISEHWYNKGFDDAEHLWLDGPVGFYQEDYYAGFEDGLTSFGHMDAFLKQREEMKEWFDDV